MAKVDRDFSGEEMASEEKNGEKRRERSECDVLVASSEQRRMNILQPRRSHRNNGGGGEDSDSGADTLSGYDTEEHKGDLEAVSKEALRMREIKDDLTAVLRRLQAGDATSPTSSFSERRRWFTQDGVDRDVPGCTEAEAEAKEGTVMVPARATCDDKGDGDGRRPKGDRFTPDNPSRKVRECSIELDGLRSFLRVT